MSPPIARALLLVALMAPLAAFAQEPADGELETAGVFGGVFGEAIDVNVVNVEVYVHDKAGRPVNDLTVEDFELYHDGRPVAITNFYAVAEGRRVEPGPSSPREPSAPEPAPRTLEVPEDERLRLVVLIDNYNLRPLERNRVLDELRLWLGRNVGAEDRVMLLTFDRGLKVRQPFTSDARLVNDALHEIEDVTGQGGRHDAFRRAVLHAIEQARTPNEAMGQVRPYADAVFHELNLSIDGLRDVVDFVAGLPGRKAVLHVSSGLPMVAAADLFTALEGRFDTSGLGTLHEHAIYDASRRFDELAAQANANGVTFYTLDAGGLRVDPSRTAEEEGLDVARIASRVDSDYRANRESSLQYLAQATGGRAILNQNNVLPALAEVATDFRNYYSLGFTPAQVGDGRYYRLKVKVRRKGLEVRHREGYRHKNTAARMADGTRAALLHSFEHNPLGVELAFGDAERSERDRYLVPIRLKIPVANLVLLPAGDAYRARVRLFVAAMDEDGDVSEVRETPIGIDIPATAVEAARGESWLYTHRLMMRRGRQKVALGLRDELGGEASFLARAHAVGG